MRHCYVFFLISLGLLNLASCSSPTASAPAYPQNPAVSDALGHPRDTTTFYFPAADSLHDKYLPKSQWPETRLNTDIRFANCAYELVRNSYILTYFQAPVLSNYYLGQSIYRFLWLRSFDRPVLLTLYKGNTGLAIRTQILDKYPNFEDRRPEHPDSLLPSTSAYRKAYTQKIYRQFLHDPKYQAWVAEGKRRARQITKEETMVAVTSEQWQHFQSLLKTGKFNLLQSCQPDPGTLDGATWLLEAHQAGGYHMVSRHSPTKTDDFRKTCEYLLDLSSVRNEERY
ncbi:hypothetical protein EU556_21165 [Hymenobacter fodinae]|uniref:Uncharacterized protein n=2 Tax=Hymenobacter fodinae TaxID=2510796 RepID=A0A4Z0P0L1_9BACT|nr:hypothetical protein EU556_21165 [Hymenobacter fodinae]